MKAVKNFYFILGISREACATEIEAAYESWKALAAVDEYHALMAEEKREAFECLSDPKLRKQHDEMLGTPPSVSAGGGNVHNFGSAERGVALQIEFNKQRRKRKARRNLVSTATAAFMLLAIVGYGITQRDEYFSKATPPPDVTAVIGDIQSAEIPITPFPEPERTAAQARTSRGAQPYINTYSIPTLGQIINDRAPCRPEPSSLSRTTAAIPKDTSLSVAREARDGNGNLWYYVNNSQFEGWVAEDDIRVYK